MFVVYLELMYIKWCEAINRMTDFNFLNFLLFWNNWKLQFKSSQCITPLFGFVCVQNALFHKHYNS